MNAYKEGSTREFKVETAEFQFKIKEMIVRNDLRLTL